MGLIDFDFFLILFKSIFQKIDKLIHWKIYSFCWIILLAMKDKIVWIFCNILNIFMKYFCKINSENQNFIY